MSSWVSCCCPSRIDRSHYVTAPSRQNDVLHVRGTDGASVVRGTSFGSYWVEVCADEQDTLALDGVVADRGRTGPKSMRVDDAIVRLAGDEVEVSIGSTRVGALGAADTSRYAPVLELVGCSIESSGIVVIDAEGHPGSHVKLYLPDPDLLLPANALDPTVPLFPAHDRAGSVTLAKRKSDHALINSATCSWWSGTARSAWVVLTRSGIEITAQMDGLPLPRLDADRTAELRSAWDRQHPEQPRLQLEAEVYEIKAGRQICIRHQFVF